MTFSKQMIISLVMIIICLVSLPFVVYFIPGLTGFLITCLIIFSQGVACASINNCLFRVSGSLPEKYIIALSSGQSLAGIIMCVIRYIIIALFQDREDDIILFKSALIFFSISAIIQIANVFAVLVKDC